MDKVLNFDPSFGIISAEAGTTLQSLQAAALQNNAEFPFSLPSRQTVQIGDCLAANLFSRDLKHGLRANTIGLKVVKADGTILDNMTTLRKDNTGYDLKQLFIGAEGSLGIITECAVLCGPKPKQKRHLCMLTPRSFNECLQIAERVRTEMFDILRTCEFMDYEAVSMSFE